MPSVSVTRRLRPVRQALLLPRAIVRSLVNFFRAPGERGRNEVQAMYQSSRIRAAELLPDGVMIEADPSTARP